MRTFTGIAILLFLVSCTEDTNIPLPVPDPVPKTFGALEAFINQDTAVRIARTPVSYSGWKYEESATDRGHIFKPLADIRVTEIGGKIAQEGRYLIEIFLLESPHDFFKVDTLLVDSIEISEPSEWQFHELVDPVILLKDSTYLIVNFNETHDSVYDAIFSASFYGGGLFFPRVSGEIEYQSIYWTYRREIDGKPWVWQEGRSNRPMFRGLVDFKYETLE